jgi:hypothetical protein
LHLIIIVELMLQTICMTLEARPKLFTRNAFLLVFFNYLFLLVFMASVTAILAVCRSVAHLALHYSLITMIDRELVAGQLRGIPAGGVMAILAFESKVARVDLRLKVTTDTLLRGPFVNLPHVASLAIDLDVFSIQREEFRMVKVVHPVNAIMTIKTITSKLRLMLIDKFLVISSMAINAGLRGKFIHAVRMAAVARYGYA